MNWGSLLRGTSWIFGSQVATRLSGMLTSVIVARWLGPAGLGELALVRDMGVVAVPLLTCGISQALTRAVGRARGSDNARRDLSQLLSTVAVMTLLFTLLAPLLILTFARPLAAFYDMPALAPTIRILALVVMVSVPYEIINAVIAGFEEFKALGVRQLISALLSPVIILFCVSNWGVAGAILSSGMVNLLLLALLLRHFWKNIYHSAGLQLVRPVIAGAKDLLRVSAPLLGSILLMRPLNLIGSSTLVLHASLVELGWFRVAYTLYGLTMVLPSALQMPLLAMFATMAGDNAIGSKGILISRWIIIFSMPFFVVGILFSGSVTLLLFGSGYIGAEGVVALMLVVGFVAMVVTVLETNVISQGRTLQQFFVNVVNALVFVGSVQLLVPRFAHWGLAVTYLLTEGVAFLLYAYVFLKSHRREVGQVLGPFVVSFILLVLSFVSLSFAPGLALKGVLVIFSGVLSYWSLNAREREGIRKYVKIG